MSPPKLTLVDGGLPECLSVLQSDANYDEKAKDLSGRIDVILDGRVLDEVSTYDVGGGFIVRQRRDLHGKLMLERGVPVLEVLKGKVEVRWRRDKGAPS